MEVPDEHFVRQALYAAAPYLSATATFRRTFAVCLGLFPIVVVGAFVWTAGPTPFRGVAAFSTVFVYKWSLDYFRRTRTCFDWVPWFSQAQGQSQ